MHLRAYIVAIHAALVSFLLASTPAGSGSITLMGAGKASTSGGLDPATTAWIAAVVSAGGSVGGTRQTVVNTFITCMKSASLWTTMDRYWLFAGENAGSAKVDMVNLQSLSIVGSPTFSASNGYTSVDAANYVDTQYTPSSSAVNYTLNSAVFGGQVQTNRTTGTNTSQYSTANGAFSNVAGLNGLASGGFSEVRVNSSGNDAAANTTAKGSWVASRTGSSAGQLYYNGSTSAPGVAISASSTGLPDVSFVIGAVNQGGSIFLFSGDQVSSFFTASGWNSTQAGNFETCQNAMMTSIGINVH